ncbi:MAG TPA: hypothetical protein VNF05_07755, partial [Acidimicrobiales bacterium]|nr:hypothetical protein [Acidimicrobiales bacterium]
MDGGGEERIERALLALADHGVGGQDGESWAVATVDIALTRREVVEPQGKSEFESDGKFEELSTSPTFVNSIVENIPNMIF